MDVGFIVQDLETVVVADVEVEEEEVEDLVVTVGVDEEVLGLQEVVDEGVLGLQEVVVVVVVSLAL